MQTLRNVAIIAVLALGVAALPGGGTPPTPRLRPSAWRSWPRSGFFVYRLYMQNQLTLATLTDARRAVLFGALGVIALMIAGADELLDTGAGAVAWIVLIAVSALAIFRVWSDATTYS